MIVVCCTTRASVAVKCTVYDIQKVSHVACFVEVATVTPGSPAPRSRACLIWSMERDRAINDCARRRSGRDSLSIRRHQDIASARQFESVSCLDLRLSCDRTRFMLARAFCASQHHPDALRAWPSVPLLAAVPAAEVAHPPRDLASRSMILRCEARRSRVKNPPTMCSHLLARL